jgi:type IV secretory pathway VirB2 component (pilin)
MAETTMLIAAGKKMSVPRILKRLLQMALGVALSAAVIFVMIVGGGFLNGQRITLRAGYNQWLTFMLRPDILTVMVLTAAVTVLLVYWQRDKERKIGGRPGL